MHILLVDTTFLHKNNYNHIFCELFSHNLLNQLNMIRGEDLQYLPFPI